MSPKLTPNIPVNHAEVTNPGRKGFLSKLFGGTEEQQLCRWADRHQTSGSWRRSQVPLAVGTGRFPSLCLECRQRATGVDAARLALSERREKFFRPRHEALLSKYFSTAEDKAWIREAHREPSAPARLKPEGFDARKAAFERDYAALRREAAAIFDGGTHYPEHDRAMEDAELGAEDTRYEKALMRSSGVPTARNARDEASVGQVDEWELRKQAVAAIQRKDFAEGARLEAEANRIGSYVVAIREQVKSKRDDDLVG